MSRGPKSEYDLRALGWTQQPNGSWSKGVPLTDGRTLTLQLSPNENRRLSRSAKPEQTVRDDSLGKAPRKESNSSCRKVSIVSYRSRLIDPDNITVKFFVDALRYCGVIEGDSAKHITLEVRQEKSDNPRTEITIE